MYLDLFKWICTLNHSLLSMIFYLLQVVLGTLVSYFANLEERHKVSIVGDIPLKYVFFCCFEAFFSLVLLSQKRLICEYYYISTVLNIFVLHSHEDLQIYCHNQECVTFPLCCVFCCLLPHFSFNTNTLRSLSLSLTLSVTAHCMYILYRYE